MTGDRISPSVDPDTAPSNNIYVQPLSLLPCVGSRVVRIDPLRFLAGCRTNQLNEALSDLSLCVDFSSVSVMLLTRAPFCVVFCYLCVLSLGCSC